MLVMCVCCRSLGVVILKGISESWEVNPNFVSFKGTLL